MTRRAVALSALLVICFSGGCRAPMPSFNVFAPYGPARVPPPCTGSYGSPAGYYRPGAAAVASGAGQIADSSQSKTNTDGWTRSSSPDSVQTSFTSASNSDATAEAPADAIRIAEAPVATAPAELKLGGMPANDLTQAEPERFVPAPDARSLASPRPDVPVNGTTVIASPPSSPSAANSFQLIAPPSTTLAPTRTAADQGWRSRFAAAGS